MKPLFLGLEPYLEEPLGLIVHVGSCKDNSTSVRGRRTIGEDERGVKV